MMINQQAKWPGWQPTSAAAQHLERLKQMQDQIYRILSSRSGKPLRQIIKDTKRTDFYLDAQSARDYGLIDEVVAGELPEPKPVPVDTKEAPPSILQPRPIAIPQAEAAREQSEEDAPGAFADGRAKARPYQRREVPLSRGSSSGFSSWLRATRRADAPRCRRPNAASAPTRSPAHAGSERLDPARARRRTVPSCAALPRSARDAHPASAAGTA